MAIAEQEAWYEAYDQLAAAIPPERVTTETPCPPATTDDIFLGALAMEHVDYDALPGAEGAMPAWPALTSEHTATAGRDQLDRQTVDALRDTLQRITEGS